MENSLKMNKINYVLIFGWVLWVCIEHGDFTAKEKPLLFILSAASVIMCIVNVLYMLYNKNKNHGSA